MSELNANATQEPNTADIAPTEQEPNSEPVPENAEIARLKAELAKARAATDKATREAGDFRKQLRARQTAEEAAAEAEKERQEAIEKELAELRKERAVANSSKRVMTFVNDEQIATSIAEALYGAADIDLAIDVISKAWATREKALRMEFGKVPAPGIGATEGPSITQEQLAKMTFRERVEFSQKHPQEYNALMGRTT